MDKNILLAIGNDIVNELVLQLERNGNVNTGKLKNSIDIEIGEDEIIVYMEDYWEDVEFGTNPHIIKPKNRKALKFEVNGETIFTKEVHHPGTRPSPFLRPVLYTKLQEIVSKYAE